MLKNEQKYVVKCSKNNKSKLENADLGGGCENLPGSCENFKRFVPFLKRIPKKKLFSENLAHPWKKPVHVPGIPILLTR